MYVKLHKPPNSNALNKFVINHSIINSDFFRPTLVKNLTKLLCSISSTDFS